MNWVGTLYSALILVGAVLLALLYWNGARVLGKVVSWIYWRVGRKYDGSSFWSKVAIYHLPVGISGTYLFTQLNEMTTEFEYKAALQVPPGVAKTALFALLKKNSLLEGGDYRVSEITGKLEKIEVRAGAAPFMGLAGSPNVPENTETKLLSLSEEMIQKYQAVKDRRDAVSPPLDLEPVVSTSEN